MAKPARSRTAKEHARPGKTREATVRYDLSRDDWDVAQVRGNKHFAGQMRLHLTPSLDGLRSDETRELLVRRGVRFIAFRCRTHAPKWPTLADQLVNALAKTLAGFAASEEAVGYGRPEPGDEATVECVLSPSAAMEAELLGRTGAGLEAVERPASAEKPEEPDDEILAAPLDNIHNRIPIGDESSRIGGPLPSPGSTEESEKAQTALRALIDQAFSESPQGSGPRLLTLLGRIDQFRQVARQHVQAALREFVRSQAADDYGAKQGIVTIVNATLNRLGLAIHYRDQACYLAATIGDEYPKGRFLIVPKGSKKPLLTRTHLSDLPALDLMDVVQQEAVPPPAPGSARGVNWGEREEARHSDQSPPKR
jgi:hypothetical protein